MVEKNPYDDERSSRHSKRWLNWTSIIVIGIALGVVVVLLLPAIYSARISTFKTHSANNLKQIALSIHNYHDTQKKLPPGSVFDAKGNPLFGWEIPILPYIESSPLYDMIEFDSPWDDPFNQHVFRLRYQVFRNLQIASTETTNGYPVCHYSLNQTLFHRGKSCSLKQINELSNIWLGSEIYQDWQPWGAPFAWHELNYPAPKAKGEQTFPGNGFNVAMLDGSIVFLSSETDLSFIEMIKRNSPDVDKSLFQKPKTDFRYRSDTDGWTREERVIAQKGEQQTTVDLCWNPIGKLKHVYLSSTAGKATFDVTTDEMQIALKAFPNAETFVTDGTLTDQLVESLLANGTIQHLRIGGIELSAQGLESLSKLRTLRTFGYRATDQKAETIKRALPHCEHRVVAARANSISQ